MHRPLWPTPSSPRLVVVVDLFHLRKDPTVTDHPTVLITTVFADGSTIEKHLSGSVARRYLRTQRAKIGKETP